MPMTSRGRPLTSTVWPTMLLAAERGLPQLVREDHDRRQRNRRRARRRRRAGQIGLALAEQPALRRLHAERGQQAVVDRRRPDAQRPIAGGEVDLAGRERADRRERLVDLAKLEILRRRHPELSEPERRKLRGQVHQLFGLGIAQRPQDHAVDDREDRGIRADAQRQRQDRDDREAGARSRPRTAWRRSWRSWSKVMGALTGEPPQGFKLRPSFCP